MSKQSFAAQAKRAGGTAKPIPEWIAPELATLAEHPPQGQQWIHENKFDGYRLVVKIDSGDISIFTRNHNKWNEAFPELLAVLKKLPARSAFLDGEITVVDEKGRTSFQPLQNSIKGGGKKDYTFFVFDCMYVDGIDLRNVELYKRKDILSKILSRNSSPILQFSEHIEGHGTEVFSQACKSKSEGIISKDRNSSYASRRTTHWLKTKCVGNEEFVIVGFTPHSKAKNSIGALLLASKEKEDSGLIYRGKVGTGFNDKVRKELFFDLSKLQQKKTSIQNLEIVPFTRDTIWVKPKKVAQIKFTEQTFEGLLRHLSFMGIREDKSAREVIRETPLRKAKKQ